MTWPSNPQGSMVPVLEASIEAAKSKETGVKLTSADRCDRCPASAVYRVRQDYLVMELDFCLHHWRRYFPAMSERGWVIRGANPELAAAIGLEQS